MRHAVWRARQPFSTPLLHACLAPDVSLGDVLLVDGGIISFKVVGINGPDVEVSRREGSRERREKARVGRTSWRAGTGRKAGHWRGAAGRGSAYHQAGLHPLPPQSHLHPPQPMVVWRVSTLSMPMSVRKMLPHERGDPNPHPRQCEVIDPGVMQSRRHLNVRGKSATLPAVTDKDWQDLKFGVDVGLDYYALSFVQARRRARPREARAQRAGARPGCAAGGPPGGAGKGGAAATPPTALPRSAAPPPRRTRASSTRSRAGSPPRAPKSRWGAPTACRLAGLPAAQPFPLLNEGKRPARR
jgi:hypothetical protein